MKNKVLKALIIIATIITITLADFIVVGMNLATYALENINNTTSNENVKFATYFKTEDKQTQQIQYEINSTEMKLYLDISVEKSGYFDGVITLEDSNFKFKQNIQNSQINKIEENKIILERIRTGNTIKLEIGIEPIIQENYSIEMLNKQSTIKLSGKYVYSDEEEVEINAKKSVTLNLVAPSTIESILQSKVITNRTYKIAEENKKLVQIEINSQLAENIYPIEENNIKVSLPENVEQIKVITKGTYATNGKAEQQLKETEDYIWNKANKQLEISTKNNSENGKISWQKNSVDSIIITLTLPENSKSGEENYKIESKIKLYGSEEKNIQNETTYNLSKEADGIIRASIDNNEEIYKGKIYSKEDREYKSTTKVEINYENLIETTNIEEKTIYRTESEDKSANIEYKTTTINKAEAQKILGEEGTLTIKTASGEIKITKDTKADENGNIVITYEAGTKELQVEITKAIETGIIRLNHTKVIKPEEYTRQEIAQIQKLVEQVNVKYDMAQYSFERIKNLRETTSEVALNITPQIISAEQNKEMQVSITLKTDSEKYELFENPTFTLTMPEGITIKEITNQTISASDEELTIAKIEPNGQREIKIEIKGKQQKYITSEINTQINFVANINVEKLMPNKIDVIEMEYTNKETTNKIQSEPIKIMASNSKIATQLKLENYNGYGMTLEKHSDDSSEVKGKIPLESTETISVPIKYTIINNYNTAISATAKIIATLTDKNLQEKELINYENSEITIEANSMKVVEHILEIPEGLYYSEKINVQAIVEYTYSGTQYSLPNNIILATEEKEGIRDISIIDNKIKLETFAQHGNGSGIREKQEVYDEQIIEYILELTNISGETISNIKITNNQENGNIYDLKEVIVSNGESELTQHRYAELDTNQKTFELKELNAGETIELICRVVAKKSQSGVTTANISILADEIQEKTIEKISNPVKTSNLKIYTQNALNDEVQMYGNDTLFLLTNVKNLTNKKMKDVKVKIYMSEGFTYLEDYKMGATDLDSNLLDLIGNITFDEEEQCVEVTIKELKADQEIIISSFLYMKALPIEQLEKVETIYTIVDEIISNSIKTNIKQNETSIKVTQSVNIEENNSVKDEEIIIIKGQITNTGAIDTTIIIEDRLNNGLEIQKVEITKNNQNIDKTEETEKNSLYIPCEIAKGETITITIEAKVNTSRITTDEITNVIIVQPKKGEEVISNIITIKIDSNIDTDTGVEEPENPDTPENPDNPTNPGEEPVEQTYTISGYAWADKNNNGSKDSGEAIKDVIVKIIDLENKNTFLRNSEGQKIEVKTDANGLYEIKDLPKGNYSIIFKYDTDTYELKENEQVKNYIIESTNEKVAITTNIKLEESKTIDLQLVEKTDFDLKIDKYITKVVVQTSKETKTIDYTNKQLVRQEINKKYISGATILVEYTLKVSNIGELSGYATEIIDYLPEDMEFHSELNTQWYKGEDNNLYNTSLANAEINPGEIQEVKLILLKTMNSENAGVTSNNAEIINTMNSKEYEDIDINNNHSKAEIIINIATGTVFTYAIVVLNAMVIVLVGIYIINKKIVRKVRI